MNSLILNQLPAKMDRQLDYILLDGSGSMIEKWWDMLHAIDAYVAGLKTGNIKSHLKLQVFDSHDLELVARDCPIEDWKTFAADPIGAHWGGTPLYDAINRMGLRLRDLAPPRCSVLIVTDGYANGSCASETQARAVLDWCRAQGWQVTFMGCDFNNSAQAKALGASEANTIGVSKKLLTDAAKVFAEKRIRHATTGEPISFTETERQQFGGLLGFSGQGRA